MKKIILLFNAGFWAVASLFAQTTHTVQMTSADQFSPANLTIEKGDIVQWTNADSDDHTSTSGSGCTADGKWDSGVVAPGGTFSFTFNTAGSFPYHCSFHCAMGMVGTITVNDAGVTGTKSFSAINFDMKTYPNPFTEFSKVELLLEEPGKVKLEVKNLLGKVVFESSEDQMEAGVQSIAVDGAIMNEGIYICTIFYNGEPAGTEYLIKSSK